MGDQALTADRRSEGTIVSLTGSGTRFDALWQELGLLGLATANIGFISDIIACAGLNDRALANARSVPVAQQIRERFADLKRVHDIGEMKFKISGCINAGAHHHDGRIGILGVGKKGEESCQITLGGDATETASLGALAYFSDEGAVETIVDIDLEQRQTGERL